MKFRFLLAVQIPFTSLAGLSSGRKVFRQIIFKAGESSSIQNYFVLFIFCVAPLPGNILAREVYTTRIFWAILVKILGSFQKSSWPQYVHSDRRYSKLSGYFCLISKEYSTIILDVEEASKSFNINIPKFSSSHFLASTWRVLKIRFFDYITF